MALKTFKESLAYFWQQIVAQFVRKEDGKGLSSNDFTDAEKTKLANISASADAVSFTRSLTSGTAVGTLNINGTNTVLYAPTDTDTHYTTGLTAGASGTTTNASTTNPYIKVKDNSTHRAQVRLQGGGATTVTSDASGVITISSTDTNTTYSAATTSADGLMTSTMVSKLNSIAAGATADTAITTAEIDTICGTVLYAASEVLL